MFPTSIVRNFLNDLTGAGPVGAEPLFGDQQAPSGSINGINQIFTLSNTPNPSLSLQLYWNGTLQTQGVDYTLVGATITFSTGLIPQTGDRIEVWYRY